ncbi:MAG: ABC transporter ATP-binding protein [Thermoplasmata archaeon]
MHIQVNDLSKKYDTKVFALKNISFDVNLSGILAIIGKNGAGKTTLVRILSTQLLPTSGQAFIDGYDVIKEPQRVREIIAAVPQEARAIPWLTPIQTVSSYLMWRGFSYREAREKGREALRILGLEKVENEKNRKLSGGQKRKVLVATVLASEAPLIFLDEPTTGLDYLSRKELWELLMEMKKNRLIILTTHYLEEAEILGDLIGILDKGELLDLSDIQSLRSKMEYPYSIKIYDRDIKMVVNGIVKEVSDGLQIFTNEKNVYEIIPKLLEKKIKFSIQEVSLSNIFEFFVEEGVQDEEVLEPNNGFNSG